MNHCKSVYRLVSNYSDHGRDLYASGERWARPGSGDLESGEQKLCKNNKNSVLNLETPKNGKGIYSEYSRFSKNIKILRTYFRGMCSH